MYRDLTPGLSCLSFMLFFEQHVLNGNNGPQYLSYVKQMSHVYIMPITRQVNVTNKECHAAFIFKG